MTSELFNAQKQALTSEGFIFTDEQIHKLIEIFVGDQSKQLEAEKIKYRIEGINYVAAHTAAAFESGFIDRPEAEVMDVINMILITSEYIENADPSDFTGEYPRDVLKIYREFLASEVHKDAN